MVKHFLALFSVLLLSSLSLGAQQLSSGDAQSAKRVADAREQLQKAEAVHPGNTSEIADALYTLVSTELVEGATDAETPALAARALTVAEATEGKQSKPYVHALTVNADLAISLNRAADARPLAEQAVETARQNFPGTEELAAAEMQLANACLGLGDFPCALPADEDAIGIWRKLAPDHDWDLVEALNNLSMVQRRSGDIAGAGAALQEALSVAQRARPGDPEIGALESNIAVYYLAVQDLDKASEHLNTALGILTKAYGPDSAFVTGTLGNLANVQSRLGQFDVAWKNYEEYIRIPQQAFDTQANAHAEFARSLASGGSLNRATDEALLAARMGREAFLLQARVLPERQALAYEATRPRGLDIALSVVAKHPELPSGLVYQELLRSRAMVADEMARRERGLNESRDSEVARLVEELNLDRGALLALEQQKGSQDAINEAKSKMETAERALAERSNTFRTDELQDAITPEQLRHALPGRSVLVSYAFFDRRAVDKVDPTHKTTKSLIAFVLDSDSGKLDSFDLGEAEPVQQAVNALRSSVNEESESGGVAPIQSERKVRQAGEQLRRLIWDPLRPSLKGTAAIYVVLDGFLRMVPLGALPDGKGYLIEDTPTIHLLSAERDLLVPAGTEKRTGLAVVGSPSFDSDKTPETVARQRGASVSCDTFQQIRFLPLPGSAREADDVRAIWQRWNPGETAVLRTGAEATRERFLNDAIEHRVLHIATHAFLLDSKCGGGNPLLNAGLVFAGANRSRESSILTAQQIASLDLEGVDLAVLSACNTGAGTPIDGEGVLGLERAFRVAGARNIVMSLWPADDRLTDHYMSEFYRQIYALHRPNPDAAWMTARSILRERRAAGLSTHPWYWAGFVASGS